MQLWRFNREKLFHSGIGFIIICIKTQLVIGDSFTATVQFLDDGGVMSSHKACWAYKRTYLFEQVFGQFNPSSIALSIIPDISSANDFITSLGEIFSERYAGWKKSNDFAKNQLNLR